MKIVTKIKDCALSTAFWRGFWHGITFQVWAERPQRPLFGETTLNFRVNEDSLSDWQKIEGDLWKAMDKFEEAYGVDPVVAIEHHPTSEEVLARLRKIQMEYDTPTVLTKCANCGHGRRVSKFAAQEYNTRCRCGGFMAPFAVLLKNYDGQH